MAKKINNRLAPLQVRHKQEKRGVIESGTNSIQPKNPVTRFLFLVSLVNEGKTQVAAAAVAHYPKYDKDHRIWS